jgi:predicted nucleic acid-binding protein
MADRAFIDTNILVYLFAVDKGQHPDARTAIAEDILGRGALISVQVLNEFVQVCRQKGGLEWERITAMLELIKQLCEPALPLTLETHEEALSIARRYKYRFYDALIIASAAQAGCAVLYSEDLHHGQKIGNLRIENPFLNPKK